VGLLWPVLMISGGVPSIQPGFWWAIFIGGGLNILAFILYVKALKMADMSLTVPLVTLTPLFLLVTSPLIVQEWPTSADAAGVVLLIIGSYVLNLKAATDLVDLASGTAHLSQSSLQPSRIQRLCGPLLAMARNPGSRMMLCVAFIWSITSNFDKIGVNNSSPLFWAIALFTVIAGGMVPFVFLRGEGRSKGFGPLLAQWQLLGITGGFNAIAVALQMLALTMAPVAQVIAVKRMSALISVLFGHFFFGEKGLKERLLGAVIMVSGVVIMALH